MFEESEWPYGYLSKLARTREALIRLTLNFEAEANPYFAMVEEKLFYFLAGSCFLLEGGRERLRVN